ncbi:hypothetical protein SAMN04488036_101662 [Shimia haliotis]|uniref:Glycosyltransferase n=2 Tax=Shimia haliotis TaxID=1280847 RepID=A0A1I4AX02_9RHOB|nr:hypothetical protein SAMN04488036_101662 [Shimia haliotis]
MKWGTVFPSDYVNVLFNACRKAISGQFRFVCLTDDSSGLVDGVEALPIPDIGLTQEEWKRPGVWPKLALYVPQLHDIQGRCLFIDLDMMVSRGLDEMFEHPGEYVGIGVGPAWRPNPKPTDEKHLGTGVFAFDAGKQVQILETFRDDKDMAFRQFANEQDFVRANAQGLSYWPDDWVLSFKRHLRRPIGLDLFLEPKQAPESARIIAFHGAPRPIDLVSERAGFWDKFPHLGHGQVSWVKDYWIDNGGRMPPFQ